MRFCISLLLFALAPQLLVAQQKVDIRRAATGNASVRLSGAISDVRIVGWDRDSIVLSGGVGQGSRIEGGALNITGPVSGMKFYVDAPEGSNSAANRLELRVPRNARVWIKTGSAAIDASGVTGGLDLNIVGGTITVAGDPRELVIESMDGSVTVTGAPAYARIKTATGDQLLSGGGDITASSISGAIRLPKGDVDRARFETVTGPIVFGAALARGGEVRFDTHSGAVELHLAARAPVEVDLASVTGTIENAWTSARPVAGREGRGMELLTSNGPGGGRVIARSFKGNVKLVVR